MHIPVEFSTVAYFVVPAILLLNQKQAQSWAAYSGLMAGFFYYMAMIIAGGPIYSAEPPYEIYISMFCHGALYVCGFVTVGTQLCAEKDKYQLIFGVFYVAIRAILLRPLATGTNRLLIYLLLDGALIKRFFSPESFPVILPIYYILIILFVLLSIKGFFKSNQKQYRKFVSLPNHKARIQSV